MSLGNTILRSGSKHNGFATGKEEDPVVNTLSFG